MTEDEERHADEVQIAFQMGAEWQRDRMRARIKELETELATTFKNFMAEGIRAEKFEAALEKIMDTDPDEGTSWFHDIARKALEGKDGETV